MVGGWWQEERQGSEELEGLFEGIENKAIWLEIPGNTITTVLQARKGIVMEKGGARMVPQWNTYTGNNRIQILTACHIISQAP